MSSVSHLVFGVDPDVFCDPAYFELHERLSPTRGVVIADFPSSCGRVGFEWKKQVGEIAIKRQKNEKISGIQFLRITSWLERNKVDYHMLPPQVDPRFASIDSTWKVEWGWTRNAANTLRENVSAVISAKECEEKWGTNPKWRRLDPAKGISECVPEIDEEERDGRVKRDANDLASLVAHPLRFGSILKLIDPYADYEGWHPTLDAMLSTAHQDLAVELHCARTLAGKRPNGPSNGSRNAWINWAKSQHSQKLASLRVYYWEELSPAAVELHDRFAIIGNSTSTGSLPFSGIGVGKGWDQAPRNEREVETSFWHLSRKDQKLHWGCYSEGSAVFSRRTDEDVKWFRN